MAYEKVTGPLGPDRGDQHAAVVASTIANAMRHKGRAYKVEDFVPRWGPKPERSSDELLSKATQIFSAMGGVDLRGDYRGADDPPRGVHQGRP